MGKIIGTAGHVDHGKTELIKALTGIDTDRLAEEKERGLTIDLGFAYIDLARTGRVGIIDVPGHERFLKNMLAGVGGMDLAILVIAANESVMPQTKEHFEILRFLRIRHLVVAVSKIDLVDEETQLLVKEEIKDLLDNTEYSTAPVVCYSSVSGEGIDELKKVLDEVASGIEERDPADQFARLAIDRCFDLKGIGTVITGTLLSGTLREGEEIVILPPGHKTKARQIQEHNEKKPVVHAGERVAVNLPGIERQMVQRGYVITREDSLIPTSRLLVRIEPAQGGKPVRDMTRVKVYLGSGEYIGRLELIGKRKAEAGEPFVCYLDCEQPLVALRKDRFILRYYSPMFLLGGGVVLDAFPLKRKRFSAEALSNAERLADASDEESLLLFLHDGHLPKEQLRKRMQLPAAGFEKVCETLMAAGTLSLLGNELITTERLEVLSKELVDAVDHFHRTHPLKKGIDKEQLRTALHLERPTFDALLGKTGGVSVEMNFVRSTDFAPRFDPATRKKREQILAALKRDPFKPEKIEEDDVARNLRDEGAIVRVKGGVYFHRDAVEKGKALIRRAIEQRGALTASELKDVLGTTRRYAIPFLEYLDSINFTMRKGDVRELGRRSRGS